MTLHGGPEDGVGSGAAVSVARHRSAGRSPGRSRPDGARWRTALLAAAGALVAGLAWWFLVEGAIAAGRAARDGDDLGWVLLGLATSAAVIVLAGALVLLRRVLAALGIVSDYVPKRARR